VSITNGSAPIDTQAVAAQALSPDALPRAAGGVVGRFIGRIFGNAVSSAVGTAAGTATAAVLVPELQDIVNDQWAAHPNRPLPAKSGYGSAAFAVMEKLAGLAPSTTDLMTMFRRKVIGPDLLRKGLVQGNVRSEWSDYLAKITEALLSPGELASAVVQDVMSGSEAEALAEKDGLTASSFGTLVKLAGNPPGAEQLLALWNRKEISSADVDRGLKQSHLKPEWIGAVKALAQHVPSVSDMVRFATREAYEGGGALSGTGAELPGACPPPPRHTKCCTGN
jgi:hypothetical protein